MNGRNSLMAAAQEYARRGWKVIPLHDTIRGVCSCKRGADCDKPGKHPRIKDWEKRATGDQNLIRRWWGQWPTANVALACGPSNLFAVDLDTKDGKDGPAAWRALAEAHGFSENGTLTNITPSGGRHLVYSAPKAGALRSKVNVLASGIDTRGEGGCIVVAPSVIGGRAYRWEHEGAPILPLPGPVVELLGTKKPAELIPSLDLPAGGGLKTPLERAISYLKTEAAAVSGKGGHDATFHAACECARFDLSEAESLEAMRHYNAKCSPPWSEAELLHKVQDARKTVEASGEVGIRNRPLPARGARPISQGGGAPASSPARGGGEDYDTGPTDDELGARWLAAHPETAYGLGEFRRYAAGVWSALALDAVRAEVLKILVEARAEKIKPTASKLGSVVELARVSVAIADDAWDSNASLLACANGTLHVPTGELLPHSPDHYLTSGLAFDYDPAQDAPVWRAHLEATIPGAAEFLQEFAGYCLTTDTSHELAVWFYGPPGSGKSTTIAGLRAMLGKRAGLLGLADIERSNFALTNLPGKTLVVSTEQPSDFIRAGHLLNAIISGEPINVDRKFRDPVTLIPRAKLCWAMNDLPRVPDAGSGLFRRVKVIAFPPLAESDRNPAVRHEIEREGAGILNWALEGLARLRTRGHFATPESIREATNDFQTKNDVAALFLADACARGGEAKTQSSDLYRRYREWCEENGHRAKSSTAVAEDWARLGLERYRREGKTYWRGAELKAA